MAADLWAWAAFGLLLALLGARAWVVETGHATLGRTPVTVKVLTGACVLSVGLVVGTLTVGGGAQLVRILLDPAAAEAAQDAAEAEQNATEAPAPEAPVTEAPAPEGPGTPAPAVPPSAPVSAPVSAPPSAPVSAPPAVPAGP